MYKKYYQGMTLIELMTALLLSLTIVSGAGFIYLAVEKCFLRQIVLT